MYACNLFYYDCTSIGHTLERLWEYQVDTSLTNQLHEVLIEDCTHTLLTYCSDLSDQGYVPLGTVHRHIAAPSASIDFQ